MIEYSLIAILVLLGGAIARQDLRTLLIDARLIYVYCAISATLAGVAPVPYISVTQHFTGAAIGLGTVCVVWLYFTKLRKIEAIGEADIWLIPAAGLMVGPYHFATWLLSATAVAMLLMLFSKRLSGRRSHPEITENVTAMPLTPTLIATMVIYTILLRAEVLLANQIPL